MRHWWVTEGASDGKGPRRPIYFFSQKIRKKVEILGMKWGKPGDGFSPDAQWRTTCRPHLGARVVRHRRPFDGASAGNLA